MLPSLRTYRVLTSIVALCGFLLFLLLYNVDDQRDDIYEDVVDRLHELHNKEYQSFFENNINVLYTNEGMQGIIDRTTNALRDSQIDMFTCHSLAHNIGHYGGYPQYFKDIKTYISKGNLDFCGSGFMHGVEAQLANNEYPQNIEDLYFFCKLSMPLEPYYTECYHGVGHSLMENLKIANDALEACEALITDQKVSIEGCYRGVFSENVNQSISVGKSHDAILRYCDSLDNANLQSLCSSELHGLGLEENMSIIELTNALEVCLNEVESVIVQKGCIESVATVSTDRFIGQKSIIVLPTTLNSIDQAFFEAYLNTVRGVITKTSDLTGRNYSTSVCESITNYSRRIFCDSFFYQE
jgi:hypothetical protein